MGSNVRFNEGDPTSKGNELSRSGQQSGNEQPGNLVMNNQFFRHF